MFNKRMFQMSITAVAPCKMVSGQLILVRKYLSMQATNEMMARVDRITVKTTAPVGPFNSNG